MPSTFQQTEKDQKDVEGMHFNLLEIHDEFSEIAQKTEVMKL